MPRRKMGARKYLAPATVDKRTGARVPSQWVIRDGTTFRRTGCAPEDIEGAERALQAYLAGKHVIDRSADRRATDIAIADVLNIYAQDIVDHHARPKETKSRLAALDRFWGDRKLADINGATCREYARSRTSPAAARRELEDLRSAINHHRREGYCREIVDVVMPKKSESRDRWLTRDEAAKLLWHAYRYREVQKGHETGRRSRRHVARFILVGLFTGTRAGAICSASFTAGPGRGFIDLERGVFYRKRQGDAETKKRQPPVRLSDHLLAHLRRWHSRPEPPNKQRAITLTRRHPPTDCCERENERHLVTQPAPRMIAQDYAVEFNGQPIGKINKAFRSVVKAAGLSADVTPHVLRHSACTWMMQSGVDIKKAADFLGMTVEMIEKVYGHHHPDFQNEAAGAINKKIPKVER